MKKHKIKNQLNIKINTIHNILTDIDELKVDLMLNIDVYEKLMNEYPTDIIKTKLEFAYVILKRLGKIRSNNEI